MSDSSPSSERRREDALLARRMFLAGCLGLPWLWICNVLYFRLRVFGPSALFLDRAPDSRRPTSEGGDDGGGGGDGAPTPAVGRAANVASMSNLHATGLDSALSALSVGGGGAADEHPEKRRKAAYKAYEERMLVELKSTMPGLKRQQYLDKIFQSWKKSPENPMNQQQS